VFFHQVRNFCEIDRGYRGKSHGGGKLLVDRSAIIEEISGEKINDAVVVSGCGGRERGHCEECRDECINLAVGRDAINQA